LLYEMAGLKKLGIKIKLLISERAHIIFPFQVKLDEENENYEAGKRLSALSTKRGIWPTYADKAARVGIRMVDLINQEIFREKFDLLFELQQKKLSAIYNSKAVLNKKRIFKEYQNYAKKLKPYVGDASLELNRAINLGKKILFEGAQGAMLDVDHGVYPYTTSSNTTVGGACTGTGISPQKIDKVVGVVKAYISRVGGGYLPTELKNQLGDQIREIGGEYGTTTGRPRRIGWLDLVQLRLAHRVNGFDALAITKIDVLNELKEIKVCTAYRVGSPRFLSCQSKSKVGGEVGRKILKEMPADLSIYERCQPVYKTFSGWKQVTSNNKQETNKLHKTNYKNLPVNMRRYLAFIEKELKVPIEMVSVGAERGATILK